ncbi:hypothetical protein CVT25_010503 [Psilocybe cyanescens]|uniref:Uncharacterized protein n=1 Tax=Psilocybe cyanescens TaxID=93625 RepID=A0A409X2N3_PSICY|nr:hypothetical protein CVT25_010503 [Psilocybe cyanescens]
MLLESSVLPALVTTQVQSSLENHQPLQEPVHGNTVILDLDFKIIRHGVILLILPSFFSSFLSSFLPLSLPSSLPPFFSSSLPLSPHSLQLRQPLPHILLIQSLPIRMPAAQHRTPLRHVRRGPHNPQLVHLALRLIVRDQDVELAQPHFVEHVERGFLSGPGAGGFGGGGGGGASEGRCAGPTPPLTRQEIAVAIANRMLDNATPGPANFHNDDNNKDTDPQPRNQQIPQGIYPLVGRVLTRMLVNDDLTRDLEIDVGITFQDFLDNEDDLKNTFRDFLKVFLNTLNDFLAISFNNFQNAKPAEALKKKTDENRTTDFAYREELKLCYVSPENPKEHIRLEVEGVTLWAHDPDVDHNCVIPSSYLSLDYLRERNCPSGTKKIASNATTQPIHVNITKNLLAASSSANWFAYPSHGFKRTISAVSYSSDDGTYSEYLTISDLLTELRVNYPKPNFPQYENLLAKNEFYTRRVYWNSTRISTLISAWLKAPLIHS